MKNTITLLVFLFLFISGNCQQSAVSGKVISDFGKTYQVTNPDFVTDTSSPLKVVFDVGRNFNDSTKVNPLLNTAARFLNMHVDAGVPFQNLKVALVIHGNAAYDILNDEHYQIKYGIPNPNTPLISALTDKGVQVILCGQTAGYIKILKKHTHPNIQFALSAMTALIQLQNNNYRIINF